MEKELNMKDLVKINKVVQKVNDEWYNVRSLIGNKWAMFYVMIGAREAGKSYSVMDFCLNQ